MSVLRPSEYLEVNSSHLISLISLSECLEAVLKNSDVRPASLHDITSSSLAAVLENNSSTAGLSCAMTNLLCDMTHSYGRASRHETNSYNEFVV